MHTFQPYPMELLDWNPSEKIAQDWFALTTEVDGKANAMTCSWGGTGYIWNLNSLTCYVRGSRYTKELLDKSEYYSVCFFDDNGKGIKNSLKYLGTASGRKEDKLKTLGFNIDHHAATGAPYIDEANFVFIMRKLSCSPMDKSSIVDPAIIDQFYKDDDYHYIYIGEIVEVLAR